MADEPTHKRPRIVYEPGAAPEQPAAKQPKQLEDVTDELNIIQSKIDAVSLHWPPCTLPLSDSLVILSCHLSLQLNDEFSDQVLAIEQKFSLKRKPLYAERNFALSSIPEFWVTALKNHSSIGGVFDIDDIEILKHCQELVVEDNADIKTGYQIKFKFNPENPYFSNAELVKAVQFAEGSQIIISSTAPQWKAGYEPPASDQEGRPGSRHYNFIPAWFDGEEHTVDEQDMIADKIKEEIWTNPIMFYNDELLILPADEAYGDVDEGEEYEEEGEEGEEDEGEGEEEIEA
jgi:template-activating factor I